MVTIHRNTILILLAVASCLICFTSVQGQVLYGLTITKKIDLPGGDFVKFQVNSLEECIKSCSEDDRCLAFSFNNRSRICHMKDYVTTPKANRHVISGRKLGDSPAPETIKPTAMYGKSGMEILVSIDLPGSDYKHFPVLVSDMCEAACMDDLRCKAFTFNRVTKICWLKSLKPRAKSKRGAVSGIKP